MHLSLRGAQTIVELARAHAKTIGVPMNIAVVDAGGHLLTFARMDETVRNPNPVASATQEGAPSEH
jgi:uncharacterized protein GlcG (DUF336 family)